MLSSSSQNKFRTCPCLGCRFGGHKQQLFKIKNHIKNTSQLCNRHQRACGNSATWVPLRYPCISLSYPVKYDSAAVNVVRRFCSEGLQIHASGVVKLPRQLGLWKAGVHSLMKIGDISRSFVETTSGYAYWYTACSNSSLAIVSLRDPFSWNYTYLCAREVCFWNPEALSFSTHQPSRGSSVGGKLETLHEVGDGF